MRLTSDTSPERVQSNLDIPGPAALGGTVEGDLGGDPAAGAGSNDEVIVFKTSPAMDFLGIPDRRGSGEQAADAGALEAPSAQASPWRWPVAMMVSVAILVVGFLGYKRLSPPAQQVNVAGAEPAAGAREPAGRAEPAAGIREPAGRAEPAAGAREPAGRADTPRTAALKPAPRTPAASSGVAVTGRTGEPGKRASDKSERDSKKTMPDPVAAKAPSRGRSAGRSGRRSSRATKAPAKPSTPPPAAAAAPREPARPDKARGSSTLDSLLDDAIGAGVAVKKEAAPAAEAPGASSLPEQLSRHQIRSSMNRIKGRVQACYDLHQVDGLANVGFVIRRDGRIDKVVIRGKFQGTETGSCVVKAVKKARFPKFRGNAIPIQSYPFLLQ